MIELLLFLLIALLAGAVYLWRALSGEDLSVYDQQLEPVFSDKPASAAHAEQETVFTSFDASLAKMPKKQWLAAMRQKLDQWGVRVPTTATISAADAAPVAGEWVLAPGADPAKRLLYIHGGAFIMGSPLSHRIITSKISEVSGAAVFALDYRRCPEYRRLDGLDDCRQAYRWMIDNGPEGPAQATRLYVAGDSAGGNLCLALIAWIRDRQLPAPTAVVALSPVADGTFSGPSIAKNLSQDVMLRPFFKPMQRTPRTLLLPGSWLANRVRPNDPRVSPIHGDLAGLPPLLIQASSTECLADDARRYTNKARAAGSEVTLQLWSNMMHVWQLFEPELDEAKQAFEQIRLFIAQADADRPA